VRTYRLKGRGKRGKAARRGETVASAGSPVDQGPAAQIDDPARRRFPEVLVPEQGDKGELAEFGVVAAQDQPRKANGVRRGGFILSYLGLASHSRGRDGQAAAVLRRRKPKK